MKRNELQKDTKNGRIAYIRSFVANGNERRTHSESEEKKAETYWTHNKERGLTEFDTHRAT